MEIPPCKNPRKNVEKTKKNLEKPKKQLRKTYFFYYVFLFFSVSTPGKLGKQNEENGMDRLRLATACRSQNKHQEKAAQTMEPHVLFLTAKKENNKNHY